MQCLHGKKNNFDEYSIIFSNFESSFNLKNKKLLIENYMEVTRIFDLLDNYLENYPNQLRIVETGGKSRR